MSFHDYDLVRIKDKDVIGTIVDIFQAEDGKTVYTVQNREYGYINDPDAMNQGYAFFHCLAEQLEKAE